MGRQRARDSIALESLENSTTLQFLGMESANAHAWTRLVSSGGIFCRWLVGHIRYATKNSFFPGMWGRMDKTLEDNSIQEIDQILAEDRGIVCLQDLHIPQTKLEDIKRDLEG